MDEFFSHYANPVCRKCDSRALNEHDKRALHVNMYAESIEMQKEATEESRAKGEGPVLIDFGDDGDNPVFVGGIKYWRRYRFGGWVTMRDFDDCKDIGEFYDKYPMIWPLTRLPALKRPAELRQPR